jgi:hypothetical protein
MSISELKQNQRAIQSLKEEISILREQQIAAQNLAALAGMTIDQSEQYKKRHHQIESLTSKLAVLDSEQVAHNDQEKTQAITGASSESAQARCSTRTRKSGDQR